MRLAFLGTPDFAATVLTALADAGHQIVCVYSQPPRPAGRGKALRPSPVQAAAEARGFAVATPESFRGPAVLAEFAALNLGESPASKPPVLSFRIARARGAPSGLTPPLFLQNWRSGAKMQS